MAQNLIKNSNIQVIVKIKEDQTFDFVATAGKIKSIIDEFESNRNSVKDMYIDLSKKMIAYKDEDVDLVKMTDDDVSEFMDVMAHWVFAYKIIFPEDITLTVNKV